MNEIDLNPIKLESEDLFGYRAIATSFLKSVLMKRINSKRMTAVYGEWGVGKSSFINLLGPGYQKIFQSSEEAKSKYYQARILNPFSAWTMEHVSNLNLAIIRHLEIEFKDDKIANKVSIKHEAKELGIALLKIGANYLGDTIQYSGLGNDLAEMKAKSNIKTYYNRIFENEIEKLKAVESVKETLNSICKKICGSIGVERIIVPIEDIDRCDPKVAINLLFSLKHFYHSENLIFIVTCDKTAIAKFLSLHYGNSYSLELAEWFIERIFDYSIDLKLPRFESLLEKVQVPKAIIPSGNNTYTEEFKVFKDLMRKQEIERTFNNPRKINRCINQFLEFLEEYYSGQPYDLFESKKLVSIILIILIREFYPKLYDSIRSQSYNEKYISGSMGALQQHLSSHDTRELENNFGKDTTEFLLNHKNQLMYVLTRYAQISQDQNKIGLWELFSKTFNQIAAREK